MIAVDSSVVVAIMRHEHDAANWIDALEQAPKSVMSIVSYVETNIVISGRRADALTERIDNLLRMLRISVVPVTLDQGAAALAGYMKFGKGRHPARLNIADCFSYGLAKSRDFPLLFKGDDFLQTDIIPAWRP
jgi:ribonuclease VapC